MKKGGVNKRWQIENLPGWRLAYRQRTEKIEQLNRGQFICIKRKQSVGLKFRPGNADVRA